MVKITSESWVEKDDPMFIGRFHVHSLRGKDSGQRKKKKDKVSKDMLKNRSASKNAL
jgi:hypothetical protein